MKVPPISLRILIPVGLIFAAAAAFSLSAMATGGPDDMREGVSRRASDAEPRNATLTGTIAVVGNGRLFLTADPSNIDAAEAEDDVKRIPILITGDTTITYRGQEVDLGDIPVGMLVQVMGSTDGEGVVTADRILISDRVTVGMEDMMELLGYESEEVSPLAEPIVAEESVVIEEPVQVPIPEAPVEEPAIEEPIVEEPVDTATSTEPTPEAPVEEPVVEEVVPAESVPAE